MARKKGKWGLDVSLFIFLHHNENVSQSLHKEGGVGVGVTFSLLQFAIQRA